MAGIRGKKTPGKPGRFDPSEPLHMTTRRAAKGGPNNSSPSINGSLDDSGSRRGSLDDLRPLTSHSNGSQVSAKSRRLSELSVANLTTPDNHLNGIHSSEEKRSGRSLSKPLSPVQQTPSPSRKRKRSTSSQPEPPSAEQPASHMVSTTEFGDYQSGLLFADEGDTVDVIRPEDPSDRKRSPSQDSYESELANTQEDVVMAEASMDATPAVSEPVSPVTSESRSQEDTFTKPLDEALGRISQAAEEQPDDQDDADEIVDAGEDVGEDVEVEEADEVDEQAEDDGKPRRGRFGGRRRAKHPNPQVEKAMQRQAELKSAYRAIARAQKAVLAEIAQRTVDDLQTNEELHLQASEYQYVKKGLDNAYARRKQQLNSQQEHNIQQLGQTLQSEQQMMRMICNERLSELQEQMLVDLEHKMLMIERQAQLDDNSNAYETEDEDDVVPRPKRTGYKFKRSGALEPAFDSRSQRMIDTIHANTENEGRFKMRELLKTLKKNDQAEAEDGRDGEAEPAEVAAESGSGFTIMDSIHREIADHKRLSIANTGVLAQAAREKENTISNEDAIGLQMLAGLASRPAIAGSVPPPSKLQPKERDFRVDQSPSRPMPPHLRLNTGYGPNSIPVEMSPRTTQAMGDRFDTSMPPPLTPRQVPASFMHSPDLARPDFSAMSPPGPGFTPRANGFGARRQSDSRPDSAKRAFPDILNSPADRPNRFPDMPNMQFHADERRSEMPGWQEYPSAQPPASARRTSFSGRTSFTFSSGVIPPGERDRVFDTRPSDKKQDDEIKYESSPYQPLNRPAIVWPEPLSRAGAPDSRQQDARSPDDEAPRFGWKPLNLAPRSPTHSRNPSATFSLHDRRRDSEDQGSKPRKGLFPMKSNKEERGGLPRRHWTNQQKRHSKSLDKPTTAGSPTMASPPVANSPMERAPPLAPWGGPQPPQHSPIGPPPPTAIFGRPPSVPYGPPTPHFPASGPGHDFYHRNSFPGPPQQQSPASIWNQPQSHLYAVPQHLHPPPPGVPPEQYSRFAPPPPPGFQGPPPLHPPHTPQPSHPQSAPGSYGHQFGGPPLAPATANPAGFHPQGIRPGPPPPAFAQQAQQQGGFGRKRAASDVGSFPKFMAYQPNQQRR